MILFLRGDVMSEEKFRIKSGYVLREVAGEFLAISVSDTENPSRLIVLNPVSAVIWRALQTEKTVCEIVKDITSEFDVSEKDAADDVAEFIEKLKELNFLA